MRVGNSESKMVVDFSICWLFLVSSSSTSAQTHKKEKHNKSIIWRCLLVPTPAPARSGNSIFMFFYSMCVIFFSNQYFLCFVLNAMGWSFYELLLNDHLFSDLGGFLSSKNRLLWFRLFRSVSFMETLTSSTSRYNHSLLQPLFLIFALFVCK